MRDEPTPKSGLPTSLRAIGDKKWTMGAGTLAPHTFRFFFVADDGVELDVAVFQALGPMPLPPEGKKITLHEVPVIVTSVEVGYDASSDGGPGVVVHVAVTPFEDE